MNAQAGLPRRLVAPRTAPLSRRLAACFAGGALAIALSGCVAYPPYGGAYVAAPAPAYPYDYYYGGVYGVYGAYYGGPGWWYGGGRCCYTGWYGGRYWRGGYGHWGGGGGHSGGGGHWSGGGQGGGGHGGGSH